MKFIKKQKWLLAGGSITVLFSAFLTNSLMLSHQRAQLDDMSDELLSHAEEVTTQIVSSINRVHTREIVGCRKQDIAALREAIWKYSNVEDLGIIENGRIACTANWGVLEKLM